ASATQTVTLNQFYIFSGEWNGSTLAQTINYGETISATDTTYSSLSYLSLTVWKNATWEINWLRTRAYPPNGVMPTPVANTSIIPISISNNQGTATPAPFQQLITISPVQLGSNNFSADLGNIRFYSDPALTQPLYAWVESGNSNTVSATNIWVKLPNGIPANSTVTIYMALGSVGAEYDGVYMGEAPQLSPTYGQYDNGANVFNFYDNFAGTVLSSNWSSSGSITVNNGVFISGSAVASEIDSIPSFGISVLDWYGYASTPTGSDYWINLGLQNSTYANGWFTWNGQNNYGYGYVILSNGSTTVTYTSTPTNTNHIFSVAENGSIAYYLLDYNQQSNSYPSLTPDYILFRNGASTSGGGGANVFVQWTRIRSYPPNGVMPAAKMITIPISISNNQNTATPAPFQQLITINPVQLGSNNFSADLGNIRFYSDPALTQPLYAWVESGNSNTVSATNIWVKLPNGIPANSTVTIYMALGSVGAEYDGVYMGEAPQLSPTYGQYDNGASVFNFYDNFAGTVLSNKWTTGVNGGSITVNNGISLYSGTTSTSNYATLYYATPQNPSNIIVETIMNIYGSGTLEARDRSLRLGISMGWTDAGMFGGNSPPQYVIGSYTGTYVPIGSSATDYNLFDQWIFPSSGTLTWTSFRNNNGSPGSVIFSASTTFTIAPFTPLYGVDYDASDVSVENLRWTRIRAYPPNNIMPTITLNIPTTQLPPMF
ncbi:MAG: DUF2341 domain-containing protein, partial [Candidatus Parvarchaeota archaeon]